MEQILDAPVSTQRKIKYAGFWIRVVALFLDWLVLSFANYAVIFIFMGSLGTMEWVMLFYGFGFLLNIAYFAFMESSARQGTLGKMAVGIKVCDANGDRLTFGYALGRYFAKTFISMFTLGISLLWAGWDDKKQTLHDKALSTYVYYGN